MAPFSCSAAFERLLLRRWNKWTSAGSTKPIYEYTAYRLSQVRSRLTCSSAANDAWAETRILPLRSVFSFDSGRLHVSVAECYPLCRRAIPKRPQKKNQAVE